MSKVFTNRQRISEYVTKGKPMLSLEFDAFTDGSVSMWTHTTHGIPFDQMKKAFEAIQDHLVKFIANGDVCPFSPNFNAANSNDRK